MKLMVAALIAKDRDLQIFLGEVLRIQESTTKFVPTLYPYAHCYQYCFLHRTAHLLVKKEPGSRELETFGNTTPQ
jgi:hypothetical protein